MSMSRPLVRRAAGGRLDGRLDEELTVLHRLTIAAAFTRDLTSPAPLYIRTGAGVAILLKPTRVLFSHKKEGESTEELRTVVAYQNPFTGDYCVHKSRAGPKGYMNATPVPDSPDSGVSDEYEPINLGPQIEQDMVEEIGQGLKKPMNQSGDNSVNKTWNWNYTEYQI
ncbi:hypothetical protein RR48_02280 [Papilio machaon]|uniref:Uncharacterized protein n=1 Tax=Papilio machaon TaxID=76193 RepID=A0A0N0PD58_PAPMA|nr:hypothetical protein RR48_02280 [Papilio machaon]